MIKHSPSISGSIFLWQWQTNLSFGQPYNLVGQPGLSSPIFMSLWSRQRPRTTRRSQNEPYNANNVRNLSLALSRLGLTLHSILGHGTCPVFSSLLSGPVIRFNDHRCGSGFLDPSFFWTYFWTQCQFSLATLCYCRYYFVYMLEVS